MARLFNKDDNKSKRTEVRGISRWFIEEEKGKHTLIAGRTTLSSFFQMDEGLRVFDGLMINEMMGILHIHGVELLWIALTKQFVKVFDAYGLPVNIN